MNNIEKNTPNEEMEDAQRIYEEENMEGYVDYNGDADWYKIKFAEDGNANFYLQANDPNVDVDLAVYDGNKKRLANSTKDGGKELITLAVKSGVYYYIRVTHYLPATPDDRRYLLRCKNYPSESSGDGDDSLDSATAIDFGERYVGALDRNDDDDFYYIESIPDAYDGFTVIVDTDFSGYDGSYKCGLHVYNEERQAVGSKSADYGETTYLKIPVVTMGGYYIKVLCFGEYDASRLKRYHLETIGFQCLTKSQTCIETAIPIQVNDHYLIRVSLDKSYFYSIYLEDSREITFVSQTDLRYNRCKIRLYDENQNLLAQTSYLATAHLTYRLIKDKIYYIELVPDADNDGGGEYLFYTEPYGVGGGANEQNTEVTFQDIRPKVEPPYTLGEKVTFDGTVINNTSHPVMRTIRAMMRDQNSPQGSGNIVSVPKMKSVEVAANDKETAKMDVTMARTGYKDIVFEIVDSPINKARNFEIRGYTINEALDLVNRVEAFIQTKHPELTTPKLALDATLTYFRCLIYDQPAFNFMLGTGNLEIARQVEQAFNKTGNAEINRLINGTILEDNNSRAIDFIHMLAVLEGCMDAAKSNKEINSLPTGWLGDIVSEAPNVKLKMRRVERDDVSGEALKQAVFEECAQIGKYSCKAAVKDLEADIDAVAIYKLYRDTGNVNMTLYQLLSKYYKRYSDAYTGRYTTFKQETTRICKETVFNRCIYNGVTCKYDSYEELAVTYLSKFTHSKILIEVGRLFAEYINTEGQTREGYNLIQNDVWWK